MVAPQNRDQANSQFNQFCKNKQQIQSEEKTAEGIFLDRSRETLGQVAYPKKTVTRFIRSRSLDLYV